MYEIEKATPDKLVFLYHLFDWLYISQGTGWELINWLGTTCLKKPTIKYLKESFTLEQLERDKPKHFECCQQNTWWKKLLCWLYNQ